MQGDAGAPVEDDEMQWLENNIATIAPFMSPEGLTLGQREGFFSLDFEDKPVTNCLKTGECVFLVYENGIAKCGIEKAHYALGTQFKKPGSCHLYPIRISQVGDYEALNYHAWEICSPALTLGEELGVPMYQFLKEPLITRYGRDWFIELEKIYEAWKDESTKP